MLGCSSVSSFAQTTLRLWNIHGEGYPVTTAVNWYAEQIAKATQGRYQVQVFSNASLGDQPSAVAMLKAGDLDLAEFSSAPLTEAVPGIKVLNMPFLFHDSAHMFRHLDGHLGEQFEKDLAASGFAVLGWYDGGARSFYCTSPVLRINDLAGKRIRVQKSEVYTELVVALKSTPQYVPFKEVQTAFQEGKIDCAENNMPSYESTGHFRLAKHVYLTDHVVSPEALVMSTKLWSSLSPADRTIFKDVGLQSARYMRELWNKRVAQALTITTESGSTFSRMNDPGIMIRRMAPLYNKYMKDPATYKVLLTIIADK
ncbi:C4-dicarboxylate ABC transporter substrate-binding protein [Hydrogenophaga crassostreae]|uniref:C4-dicarboxylate ABC transporter substrate-binding protein n=1 Tax=Hydrogenophaga crassostreae TaxID=1763535 RepID=A0A167GKK3_9BURK|nr:C4-dicarboxylate ABC transporter substrate-binding protein [Hydrogenophaga crassostreae]OAD39578.1 C4-dicarboxylate ABC transporter substrate-binding protein [Hydrogenophaga crassostreae]